GDVLLHHPYESFEPVVAFIESAADDPDVLAIKMTLYRAEQGSPIVRALQRAAENGKQVTALVELKARMDEEANILSAREREQVQDDDARSGGDGRMVAKMNELADPEVIKALYGASQAGVEIDLVVRGVCALGPGVPKLSDRIRVKSVVDRFLEHARIWHFYARGEKKVYLASGDWMPRNFIRRVDVAFPVESALLKERILCEILGTMPAD